MGSCTSECDSEFMWCTEHFKIVQVQAQAPYFYKVLTYHVYVHFSTINHNHN